MRRRSSGAGRSLPRSPLMASQRQTGASFTSDLRPSQHAAAGGATLVLLVRNSAHGVARPDRDVRHSAGCGGEGDGDDESLLQAGSHGSRGRPGMQGMGGSGRGRQLNGGRDDDEEEPPCWPAAAASTSCGWTLLVAAADGWMAAATTTAKARANAIHKHLLDGAVAILQFWR